MKKVYLLVLLAMMQVAVGGKARYKNTKSSTNTRSENDSFLKECVPSAAQVKDYVSWCGLSTVGAYSMYWTLQHFNYRVPGLFAPGRTAIATLAGIAGITLAQTARDAIHTDFVASEPEKETIENTKKWFTTGQLLLQSFDSDSYMKLSNKWGLALDSIGALLLTSWSMVYNPLGFAFIDSMNLTKNVWTNTVLPMAANMIIAQGGYCMGQFLFGKEKRED